MIRRQLHVVDFILYENGIAIVTDHGEAFQCTFSNKPLPVRETSNTVKGIILTFFALWFMLLLYLLMAIYRIAVALYNKSGSNFCCSYIYIMIFKQKPFLLPVMI